MSLKQNLEKIKGFLDEHLKRSFWIIIVFFTILDAYMLGYISKNDKSSELMIGFDENIEITSEDLEKRLVVSNDSGLVVASKNGTKYYFAWCSGVGRINEENKIYFNTEEEAIILGYSLAKNCE